jgi:hypothetical protein
MIDSLLLRPSLLITTLFDKSLLSIYTSPNYTSLHFTTLSFGLNPFKFPTASYNFPSGKISETGRPA